MLRKPLGTTHAEVFSPFEQDNPHLVAVAPHAEAASCCAPVTLR